MQLHYVSVKLFSPNTARVYVPEQTARNLTGGILGGWREIVHVIKFASDCRCTTRIPNLCPSGEPLKLHLYNLGELDSKSITTLEMLQTHRSSSTTTAPSVLRALQSFIRPSLRWIPWCLALAISLWVFGPFALHSGSFHFHGYPSDGPEWRTELRHRPFHSPRPPPFHPPTSSPPSVWSDRANQVRGAFIHAYSGYQKHAFPYDELLPVAGGKVNKSIASVFFCNAATYCI